MVGGVGVGGFGLGVVVYGEVCFEFFRRKFEEFRILE